MLCGQWLTLLNYRRLQFVSAHITCCAKVPTCEYSQAIYTKTWCKYIYIYFIFLNKQTKKEIIKTITQRYISREQPYNVKKKYNKKQSRKKKLNFPEHKSGLLVVWLIISWKDQHANFGTYLLGTLESNQRGYLLPVNKMIILITYFASG